MNKAKVFLLTKKTHINHTDFSNAAYHGELVYLIGPDDFIDFYNFDESFGWLQRTLLNEYDAERDYILLTGNVAINVAATNLLLRRHDTINILCFDRKKNEYSVRTISNKQLDIYSKRLDTKKDEDVD